MRHLWILIIGLTLCCSVAFAAEAEPFKTKVNLVLDDGTIMLYAGTKKGVQIGDEFELVRNGVKVGTIKITKASDLASYAKIATVDTGLGLRTSIHVPVILRQPYFNAILQIQ